VSFISYEQRNGIAYITLDRPEVLNALTDEMVLDLRQAFFRFDDDEDAKVAILSGSGRAFCSGADVRQRRLRPIEELRRLGGAQSRDSRIQEILYGFTNWKPIIAAVHGYVLGAGLYIALTCEMIVAAEGTKFQITETSLGTDATNFWFLLRDRAWGGFASEVAVTGRFWTAEEGIRVGAVDRVCGPGEQVEAATKVALTEIIPNPPLSVRAVVEARRGATQQIELDAYVRRPRGLHLTEDFRESAQAFVDKRKPVFKGR
jgi:enoyl-CoA hydratase/carnithine racemase